MADDSNGRFSWLYYLGQAVAIFIAVIGFFVLGIVVMLAMLFL
jgi:hypothetical protein